jgi:hypothetical protein
MIYVEGTCGDLWSSNKICIYTQKIYVNALLDTEQVEILRNVES